MIPCGHGNCGHKSGDRHQHFSHESLHFTASVMGNPEYLAAVKDIPQAPDQRMEGIHEIEGHAARHEHLRKIGEQMRKAG